MKGDIEKKISSSIFEEKEDTPQSKVMGDLGNEELLLKEDGEIQEDTKKMTKESWEKYSEEMKEITELAKRVGFEKVLITSKNGIGIFMKSPDIIFFPGNYLANYREAVKFIAPKKENIQRGLSLKFLEIKDWCSGPKGKILQESDKKEEELEKLVNKKWAKNEKGVIENSWGRIVLEQDIDKLRWQLMEDKRGLIPESEIKDETLKMTVIDIAHSGLRNSLAVKVARLNALEKKISLLDYQNQLFELMSPILHYIRRAYPFLKTDNVQNLIKEWLNINNEFGKKYLEYENKKSKNGLDVMYG